jgi:hypothetical protein
MRPALIVFLAALVIPACGDGGSSGPSPASPAGNVTFRVVSGETDQPVAGARFVVNGTELTTNDQGEVVVDGDVPPDSHLDIIASGFLDRQTFFRPDETRLTLWPRTSSSGLHEEFTRRLVYVSPSDDESVQELRRPAPGTSAIQVAPSEQIQGVPIYMEALTDVVARMTDATGISYGLVTEPPTAPTHITIEIESGLETDPWCTSYGVAYRDGWGGGRIVLCHGTFHPDSPLSHLNRDRRDRTYYWAANILAHEMGHLFGLGNYYVEGAEGLMGFGALSVNEGIVDFSDRERLVIRLMLQRRAGNRFPDNDRGVYSQAHRATIFID